MVRSIIVGLLAYVAIAANALPAQAEASRPNIVVILADDIGNVDLGYRGGDIHTPSIDALAKGGVRLESFYGEPGVHPGTRGADDRSVSDAARPADPGDLSQPHVRPADRRAHPAASPQRSRLPDGHGDQIVTEEMEYLLRRHRDRFQGATMKMTDDKAKYSFPTDPQAVHATTAAVYSFRWPGIGWAIFTVCDVTGEFHVQSDWGNWAFRWNIDHLGCPTLTEFLARGDANYVMNKFCYTRSIHTDKVFDPEKTRDEIWRLLNEALDGDRYDISWRDEMEDALNEFIPDADDRSPEMAIGSISDDLDEFFGCEIYRLLYYSEPVSATICRCELLPRFFGYLREQPRPESVAL